MKTNYLTQTRNKKSGLKNLSFVFLSLTLVSLVFFSDFNPFFTKASSSSKSFFDSFYLISYFKSKNSLEKENVYLRDEINKLKAEVINREALVVENKLLKEKLEIVDNKIYVLANVLERPGFSPYDFLVIDEGASRGIVAGLNVFFGNTAIGEVVEVSDKSSKVEVFSSPGKTFDVLIGDKKIPANATGRGGGSFEVLLPKDIEIKDGDVVILADNPVIVFGVVSSSIKDEEGDFTHIYFNLPINLYEINEVMVAI